MFPLRIERWWNTVALGRPFLVFDGCAQYLTSPFAAQLLRAAAGPKIVIIVCLREPVQQNVSWWKFENASMMWFDSMGIPRSLKGIEAARSADYPPQTLSAALALSRSDAVERLYAEAEALPAYLPKMGWVVPQRYITWPNGQLSALARNGCYAANIERWHKWFNPDRFVYFELGEYDNNGTEGVVRKLHAALPTFYRRLARSVSVTADLHENQAPPDTPNAVASPTQEELDKASVFYASHNERLFALLGQAWPQWQKRKQQEQH